MLILAWAETSKRAREEDENDKNKEITQTFKKFSRQTAIDNLLF
jgi:hypothetical protein